MTIFNFNNTSDISNWNIVDDVVMGGRSNGTFSLSDKGKGIFKGIISLENNGGFSMVQYRFNTKLVNDYTTVIIKLKGDGKSYQFRIKTNHSDDYSYVAPFQTSGNLETIEIPFKSMYPAFRGRKLTKENYPGEQMEHIAFLIGNKKAELFKLEIESIALK
jgi:NADH dehydrogenase [ubiquinone] 1 alpha subcomplex assembly factor 1